MDILFVFVEKKGLNKMNNKQMMQKMQKYAKIQKYRKSNHAKSKNHLFLQHVIGTYVLCA